MFYKAPREPIKYIEYSVRHYGQPKLKKPKELNKIKSQFSVDYIPKHCKCQCFIKENDVWVKHRDYFSSCMKEKPEDFGTPLEYRIRKYLGKNKKNKMDSYPDCWGGIVLRNEAWLCIKNLMINLDIFIARLEWEILRQQEKVCGFEELELEDTDMARFWEGVIQKCKECKK